MADETNVELLPKNPTGAQAPNQWTAPQLKVITIDKTLGGGGSNNDGGSVSVF